MSLEDRISNQFRRSHGEPEGYIPEPTVIPDGNTNSGRAWGLDSYLMHKSQMIFLTGAVTDESCVDIKKRLIYLDKKFPGKDITIYVDSPGGSVSSGDSVAAVMQTLKNDVKIIVAGDAASMGSVIASFGTPGKRFALPGSIVMVHPPGYYGGGGPGGSSVEVDIHSRILRNMWKRGTATYATVMGLNPHDKEDFNLVQNLTKNSTYLNATTAVKVGLIDDVLTIPAKAMNPAKQILQDLASGYDLKELNDINEDPDEDIMAIVKKVIARREFYINQEIEHPSEKPNPFLEYAVRKEKVARGLIPPDDPLAEIDDVDWEAENEPGGSKKPLAPINNTGPQTGPK